MLNQPGIKLHYFMLDFCYYCQLLLIVYVCVAFWATESVQIYMAELHECLLLSARLLLVVPSSAARHLTLYLVRVHLLAPSFPGSAA